MVRQFIACTFFCMMIFVEGFAQPSASTSVQTEVSTYTYRPLSEEKPEWQRLTLFLSFVYYRGMKLSKIDADSSMLHVSKSLGVNRLAYTAEGIDNPELLKEAKWFDERDPGKGILALSQTKGKKHLELLILLGSYYSFQPSNYKRYKDSVLYFLNQALAESKAINEKELGRVTLCFLGKFYAQGADTTKADSVFNQLISECQSAGDKKTEARATAYRGMYIPYKPGSPTYTIDNKLQLYKRARQLYHELGDTEGEIRILFPESLVYFLTQHFKEAEDGLTKALELSNQIGYPYTHYITDNLGMIGMFQNKFGEPLKYALQSIRTSEATRDSVGWGYFYNKLGQLYYIAGAGRVEESMKWLRKGMDRFVLLKDGSALTALYNIVGFMTETNVPAEETLKLVTDIGKKVSPVTSQEQIIYNLSLADCYLNLKQYGLVEKYIAIADSIQKNSPAIMAAGTYERTGINNIQIKLHLAKGEYKEAKKMLETELNNPKGMSLLSDEMNVYERLLIIDSALHDDKAAITHYKRYMELADSSYQSSILRQSEELQVMYQTQEKQDKITALNLQAKLQRDNLKQATLVKNLTIGGIIAVLIIAGLLFRQNRLKQKSNVLITNKNGQLQHLLTEKEWLLKEIHHRVKNNLQIVMSLLGSQTEFIDSEPALVAIHDSQHRVQAMSLIHQKLYNSENVSSIDMSIYIRELTTYLSDSFDARKRIHFELDIEELKVDVSQAVPLGLILNEAITNSIKYAFPDGKYGVISISFLSTDHCCELVIADNGIGIPIHFKEKMAGSLGMRLMEGLTGELDGDFSIENNNGTIIKISFVHDTGIKRPHILTESFALNN